MKLNHYVGADAPEFATSAEEWFPVARALIHTAYTQVGLHMFEHWHADWEIHRPHNDIAIEKADIFRTAARYYFAMERDQPDYPDGPAFDTTIPSPVWTPRLDRVLETRGVSVRAGLDIVSRSYHWDCTEGYLAALYAFCEPQQHSFARLSTGQAGRLKADDGLVMALASAAQ